MKNRKNFLVIGNPIKHSLSPFLHNYWFHKNKINCEYKKLETTKSSIKKILNRVRKREIEGINVTIPFKNSVIKYLDILKPENKGLGIFYTRKQTKIYIVTDKAYENELPEHVKIMNVIMNEGTCDLVKLSTLLLEEKICEVLIEGGGKLNTSLLKEKLIDELNIFIGPSIIIDNNALNVFNSNDSQVIVNSVQLALLETQIFDSDIVLKYKVLY